MDPGGLKAHCTLYWWKLSSFPFWFFSQLGPCICGGCTYRLPKPDTCVHPGVKTVLWDRNPNLRERPSLEFKPC